MWGAVRSLWVQSWGFQSCPAVYCGTLELPGPVSSTGTFPQDTETSALSHLRKMQVTLFPHWSPGTSLETSERMLFSVLGSFPSETAAWGKAFHMLQLSPVTSHHVSVTYINFTPNKRGDNTWGHKCSLCGEGTAHGKQSGGKACDSLSYFDLSF